MKVKLLTLPTARVIIHLQWNRWALPLTVGWLFNEHESEVQIEILFISFNYRRWS